MRNANGDAEQATGPLRRTEAWQEFRPGDPVRIAGIRGGNWRYRCHVVNERNGAAWVEVAELDVPRRATSAARVASASADARVLRARRLRSFAPERVLPLRRRRSDRRPAATGQDMLELGLAVGEPTPGPPASPPRRRRRAGATTTDQPRLFAVEANDTAG